MRRAGATIVDVRYPRWLLAAKEDFYTAVRHPEFAAQIGAYLATIGPAFPKSLGEMIARARRFTAVRPDGAGPNPSRWSLFEREAASGAMTDFTYTSVHDHGLPLVRAAVDGLFASKQLDAIVYPTSPRRPGLIAAPPGGAGGRDVPSATNIANLTGYPDLSVPAGFTGDHLPVGVSFFGPAFSEARLLALGSSFERATHARRLPVHTPLLAGQQIAVRPARVSPYN
jgi:amidase